MAKNSSAQLTQVPVDQCKVFECECGCDRFSAKNEVRVIYDRFRPIQCGLQPIMDLECVSCKKLMKFDEDGAKRIVAHHAKPEKKSTDIITGETK